MVNNILKKGLFLGIIILFIGASVLPSIGGTFIETKNTIFNSYRNSTLYVGGNGTGNFSKIQYAIDNASDGDIVYVYNGTFNESVVVDKSINLTGENRNSTIIDGMAGSYVIKIYSNTDWVNISGFTIQNTSFVSQPGVGIEINSNHNTISGNIIISNNYAGIFAGVNACDNFIFGNEISDTVDYGIYLKDHCNDNNISSNIISASSTGIYLYNSKSNVVFRNQIFNIYDNGIHLSNHSDGSILRNTVSDTSTSVNLIYGGIYLSDSHYNNITDNDVIDNNGNGIAITFRSSYNKVSYNNILNNGENGISLETKAIRNIIYHNDFDDNVLSIKLSNSNRNKISKNNFYHEKALNFYAGNIDFFDSLLTHWDRNYWGKPDFHSRVIKRICGSVSFFGNIVIWPFKIQRDFFPAYDPN